MNGLTQIKDKDGVLYDVQYDCEFERFVIWEHDKLTVDGHYFTTQQIKHYIQNGQIEIANDGNNVFKKYLN